MKYEDIFVFIAHDKMDIVKTISWHIDVDSFHHFMYGINWHVSYATNEFSNDSMVFGGGY